MRKSLSRDQTQKNIRIEATIKKIPNWKEPGPGGVQGFWMKNLTRLHRKLAEYLGDCLEQGEYAKMDDN